GSFRPKDNITLAQGGKIIIESLDYESPRSPNIWYEPYMQTLSDNKAIPITISKINEQITRGEMVELIWRLVENITDKESMVYQNDTLTSSSEEEPLSESWWKPTPKTTWQWQLTGDINTAYNVDMYDIDLEETPQKTIDKLHSQNKKVICYFSAGSYEEFRNDAEDFPEEVLGNPLEGWEDEKWLDVSKIDLLAPIMEKRLDLAVEKKCDGVEPDNMDGNNNDSGFDISYKDQIAYSKWIANEAHKRNLSVGLKNGLEQINDVVTYFDFAINEQCFEYEECDNLNPFIKANKAVFGVEYELDTSEFCDQANEMKFSWLKMDYDLDGNRTSCQK
ncbi:MAG: endo alpha-1,4 polygalactosaminidase, partial [Candidatus Gracilibacteria bacterium]